MAKTGRLVTVDMAHKTCSAASEIALVAMEGFWSLQAPIQRLGTANVHIPFSPALESLVYPTAETIARAVEHAGVEQGLVGKGEAYGPEIVLPQWGMEMQDATVVKWLKQEGDPVQEASLWWSLRRPRSRRSWSP